MKQEYNIKISKNRKIKTKESFISMQEENNVTILTLEYPVELETYNVYIEFSINGSKFRDVILNKEYTVSRAITKYPRATCQIVFEKNVDNDTEVFKSEIFYLNFKSSINAENNIASNKQIDVFNTLVDTLNLKINEVELLEQDVNNLIEDIEGRLERGEFKGEKGDKGDCNFATFEIENGSLVMNTTEDMLLDFELNDGNLEVVIDG